MASIRELVPWLQPYARYLLDVAVFNQLGPVSVNSVYRSYQDQAVLYDRFLRGASRYPVAPPGRSEHQHRLAFDINVRQGGQSPEQHALGRFWRDQMGGKWNAADPIHFSVTP